MPYEPKGRVIINRPIRNNAAKREPRERSIGMGPLLPRLRPTEGFVQAVGFTAQIISPDED